MLDYSDTGQAIRKNINIEDRFIFSNFLENEDPQ